MKKKILLVSLLMVALICALSIAVSAADTVSVTNESELLSALSQSTTVMLGNDITLEGFVNSNEAHILGSGQVSTLDLNGHTLTAPENCYISNIGGSLTITDTSVEKTGKIVAVGIYSMNGTLVIDGGTIEQAYTDDYTRSNSVLLCYGKTVVNYVNIIAKATVFYMNNSTSTLTVNGGSYSSNSDALIKAVNGTITVNGGNFVHNGDPLVKTDYGNVYINGGSFSGALTTVYNGEKLKINGGKFAFNISEYLSDFYKQNEDGEIVQLPITTPEVLIAALSEGGVVKMASDITLTDRVSNESYIIKNDVVATLDLNGYTLTAPENCFVSTRGTLTITDSSENKTGKIVGAGIYSIQNSTLIIDGITIKQVITNDVAKEAILSYADTTIKDVTVIAQYGVIGVYSGASVEVYGGSFNTTHDSQYIKISNGELKVYGGTYLGTNSSSVEEFVQDGYVYLTSTGEVLKNVSLNEVFVFLGKSFNENNSGIAVGYSVNSENLEKYMKINPNFKWGLYVCIVGNESNAIDYTFDNDMSVRNVDIIVRNIDFDNEAHLAAAIVMELYAETNGTRAYITENGVSNTTESWLIADFKPTET